MPRFLSGILETKGAAKPAEAVARATGSSPGAAYSSGLGTVGTWDIDYAVRNGLEKVIWVFRCIDVIAQSQAGIDILLKRGFDRRNGKTIDDIRLWKLLNFRTNPYERAWQTRYRLSAILCLARRGAFIEVIMGEDGRPSQLHLLPPGVTEPIPDNKTFVSGYKVTRGDYQIDELKPERVIWLRLKPHPTDPYAQMTPLMAAGIDVDTDYLARVFNRNFLANDGRPGMLITVDGGPGGMNPDDSDALKKKFGYGPARAGETSIIEAVNMTVQDLGANPRDVQWGDLLATAKERILLAFGVPESVMGNASGRTFDNADAERENFWLDTMVPHCDNIASSLDPLTGDIEDDTVLAYDYDMVDVLQRQAARRREEWRGEFAAGLITLDTYLERTGQKMLGVPASRAYFLPSGIAIAGKPEEQEVVDALKVIGAQAPPDPGAAAEAGAKKGAATGMRALNNIVAARAAKLGQKSAQPALEGKLEAPEPDTILRDAQGRIVVNTKDIPLYEPPVVIEGTVVEKAHPYLGLRHRLEGGIEGALTAWDMSQEKVVCDRLMHVKSRRGTRHWDDGLSGLSDSARMAAGAELKALDPGYAVEVDRWVDELKATVEAMVRRSIKSEMRASAGDLETNGILDVLVKTGKSARKTGSATTVLFGNTLNNSVDGIVNNIMSIVEKAARNQSSRLMDTIEGMDKNGASMKQIELAIRTSVGTRSPWRKQLATNVVTTAIEGARSEVYGKAGVYVIKSWNTVGDERVRRAHLDVDGQSRPNGKAFRVGSSSIQYPGDPAGAPEDVINCRCFLDWRVNTDKFSK